MMKENPEMTPEKALATAMGCNNKKDPIKFLEQSFGAPNYQGVIWELLKQDPYR